MGRAYDLLTQPWNRRHVVSGPLAVPPTLACRDSGRREHGRKGRARHMTIGTVRGVTLDARDHEKVARFYQAMLGGEIAQHGDWIALRCNAPKVEIGFQRVFDHQPPAWPDGGTCGAQAHLDIQVEDAEAAHRDVLALGATALTSEEPGQPWRVYRDPAGHPFCLVSAPWEPPAPEPDPYRMSSD